MSAGAPEAKERRIWRRAAAGRRRVKTLVNIVVRARVFLEALRHRTFATHVSNFDTLGMFGLTYNVCTMYHNGGGGKSRFTSEREVHVLWLV